MRGELTIDLNALRKNFKTLDNLSQSHCKTAPAVKADAYGLGIDRVAPALYECGARAFFVATVEEGIELRGLLPESVIYVLNGFWVKQSDAYTEYYLVPVLNSQEEITAYKEYAHANESILAAALHFDTGMNRLGIPENESDVLLENLDILDGLDIDLVMSHFVSSEETENPLNVQQKERFDKIAAFFPDAQKSLCNSAGIFLGQDYHYTMTRCGIGLYGGCLNQAMRAFITPVVSLYVPVLQVHAVKKGSTAGYNATYTFKDNTHVAVVSLGYADGFLRNFGNKAALYYKGAALPICGRVSMDLVICDLSALGEAYYPCIGDMLEVIGAHQRVDDLAAQGSTISYEIFTSLGHRYKRHYIG